MELISKFGIDWKLLIAQIINFAILLFVLWKFAYKPILKILEERKHKIQKGLDDAKKGEKLLEEMMERETAKMKEAEQRIGKMLEKAQQDAEHMKKEIVTQAHSQAEELLSRAKAQIQEEKDNIVKAVKSEVADIVILALSKMLSREFKGEDQKRLSDAIQKEMQSI